MIEADTFRHAVLDPDVRKRRVITRIAGVYVDADDLRSALAERGVDSTEDIDAHVRRLGGQRLDYRLLSRLGGWMGVSARRPQYWFPMQTYQVVRQSRRDR